MSCKLTSVAILRHWGETKDKGKAITVTFSPLSFSLCCICTMKTHHNYRNKHFRKSIYFDLENEKSTRDKLKKMTRWNSLCFPKCVLSHLHHHTLLLKLHLSFSHTRTHSHSHLSPLHTVLTPLRRLWSSWHFLEICLTEPSSRLHYTLLLGADGEMNADQRCLSDNYLQMDTTSNSFENQHLKGNL